VEIKTAGYKAGFLEEYHEINTFLKNSQTLNKNSRTVSISKMIKANFKLSNQKNTAEKAKDENREETKELSSTEFEDFIVKSGAAGSFMIFRSEKKDEELGLDEL
jgi:hypothetical protein